MEVKENLMRLLLRDAVFAAALACVTWTFELLVLLAPGRKQT
jgi:hypothetical protein